MINVRQRQLERLRRSVAESPAILSQVRSPGISQRLRANLELSLKYILHLAMLESTAEGELQEKLEGSTAPSLLRELIEVCVALRPTSPEWGVPSYTVDLIAIPLFLGMSSEARLFHKVLLDGASCTKLLEEYSRGIGALLDHAPFHASIPKSLRGLEKHWALYLPWMEKRSSGSDTGLESAAIATSLKHYNADSKIREAGVFDPSGSVPQSWDGRLQYLQRAASV